MNTTLKEFFLGKKEFTEKINLEENGFAKAVSFDGKNQMKKNSYWVALSIKIITQTLVSTNMGFYQLKGDKIEEVSEDIKVNKLLKKPDGKLSFRKWVKKLIGIYVLDGEVYIFLDNRKNRKGEFHILDKSDITFLKNGGIKVRVENQNVAGVKSNELVQFIDPDFSSNTKPFRTTEKIKKWLEADNSLNDLFKQVAENGSVVGGVVETDLSDPEEMEKARLEWGSLYEGFKKNIVDIILPQGYKYIAQNIAPKDVNLNGLLDKSAKNILMAMGIPETMFGVVDGKGRANIDGAFYGFVKFKILPLLEELKELFNDDILPKVGKGEIFFHFDNPIPDDKLLDAQVRQLEIGGKAVKTVNEVREEMGLEAKEGNDELNENVLESYLDELRNPDKEKEEQKKLFNSAPLRIKNKIKVVFEKKKVEKKIKNYLVNEEVKKKNLIKEKKVNEDYLEDISQKKTVRDEIFSERVAIILNKKKKKETKDLIKEILESPKKAKVKVDKKSYSSDLKSLFKEIVTVEGEETMETIPNSENPFDPEDKELKKELEVIYAIREESWDNTTREQLLRTAKDGIEAGLTKNKLNEALMAVLGKRLVDGINDLASDIVFAMSNQATNSAMVQSRVVTTKKWFAVGDEKTCNQCGAIHGKSIGVKDIFLKKGEPLSGLDGKLWKTDFSDVKHPPLHNRCRCRIYADKVKVRS